jgi:hypothetical protein
METSDEDTSVFTKSLKPIFDETISQTTHGMSRYTTHQSTQQEMPSTGRAVTRKNIQDFGKRLLWETRLSTNHLHRLHKSSMHTWNLSCFYAKTIHIRLRRETDKTSQEIVSG